MLKREEAVTIHTHFKLIVRYKKKKNAGLYVSEIFSQMLEWIVNHRTAFLATYVEIGRSCAAAKRLQEEHAR